MYATRARNARPEAFALRPSIAERLGLPYMDGALALSAAALAAFGVFALSQATVHDVPGAPNYYADRQAAYAVLGVLGMYLLTRVDYSRFRELRVGIYTFLFVSISLVFVFGFAARGSRRAFDLPFFSFQPSELGKLLLVLALAGFVIDGARRGSDRQRTLRYLCLGLAPAALVFLQPDLGTALVFVVVTLAAMYVGGVRWTHFAAIGAITVALVTAVLVVAAGAGAPLLKGYQEERLTSFLDPGADPRGAGYQQDQSQTAIGSGQLTGRGDRATQTRLDFVPERHTDFIFAILGEELGLAGTLAVLALFALFAYRGYRIARRAPTRYAGLLAGGLTTMVVLQAVINIGVTIGVLPITGVPLPFLSFGGSSMVFTMLAVGVLLNISQYCDVRERAALSR